jgi:glycosyltransferase involved in cell wall biosynthesis
MDGDNRRRPAGDHVVRVGYLINQYPRPSHTFIRREIAALEDLGVTVDRFTLRRSEALVDESDRIELARTRVVLEAGKARLAASLILTAAFRPSQFVRALALAVRVGWRSERGLFRHLAYLAEAAILRTWLREAGTHHLHAHFGTNSATVAMLCSELGGPPYSFTAHGPEEFDMAVLGLGEKIRRAAFVVAVSWFGRSQLCRWTPPQTWGKLAVVRCSVDDAFLGDGRPCPDTPRLVCVARLSEQKGHLVLLEALACLDAEAIPFELVLVGDGPLRDAIEQTAERLGISDRIHIRGWLDGRQVREQILDARVVVLPSFAEGLPVVLMEAFALRRPVIATWVAGIPELVDAQQSGWLVPPGSVVALADALRAALRTPPAKLDEMGWRGAEKVKRAHDARREATKLAKLFVSAGHAAQSARDRVPAAMQENELG